jgi:hypothetical protein
VSGLWTLRSELQGFILEGEELCRLVPQVSYIFFSSEQTFFSRAGVVLPTVTQISQGMGWQGANRITSAARGDLESCWLFLFVQFEHVHTHIYSLFEQYVHIYKPQVLSGEVRIIFFQEEVRIII